MRESLMAAHAEELRRAVEQERAESMATSLAQSKAELEATRRDLADEQARALAELRAELSEKHTRELGARLDGSKLMSLNGPPRALHEPE